MNHRPVSASLLLLVATTFAAGAAQAHARGPIAIATPNAATEKRYDNDEHMAACTHNAEDFRRVDAAFLNVRDAERGLPSSDGMKAQMQKLETDLNDERMEFRNRVDRDKCPTKV